MLQKISLGINVVLIAAVAWLYMQHFSSDQQVQEEELDNGTTVSVERDTLPDVGKDVTGNIAFFYMDSILEGYNLMQEKKDMLLSEESRLSKKVDRERRNAQSRYDELVSKDHTYSTMAEIEADQQEVQGLVQKLQTLEEQSMNDLMLLQQDVMVEILKNLQEFLEEYNEEYEFDYIISMQNEGQVWAGNRDLDITPDIVGGLNAKHKERRAELESKKSAAQDK